MIFCPKSHNLFIGNDCIAIRPKKSGFLLPYRDFFVSLQSETISFGLIIRN